MLRLISDKRQGLKEFTENNYAQGAFFWTYLLKNKEIKVNGKRVSADITLEQGDEVCYFLATKQEDKPAFHLVYEDENFLIIDKESGVNSEAVFAALAREQACYFIHRLDRNTKGLMAFALNERAEKEIEIAREQIEIYKEETARLKAKLREKDREIKRLKKGETENA